MQELEFKNITIIGSGGIGSRHFQALLKNDFPSKIQVIEPNQKSIDQTKKILVDTEVNKNIKVEFHKSIVNNNFKTDLLIICTLSNIRFTVFNEFIKFNNVSYIIFEKVVFQSKIEFLETFKIIERKKIKAWANCPNRANIGYIKFKEQLNDNQPLNMTVSGSNWGMASNLIHYLDLFCFFIDETNVYAKNNRLDKKIYDSKRIDFIEIGGTIEFASKNGDLLVISDDKTKNLNVEITISNSDSYLKVFESDNYALIKNRNKLSKISFPIEYQSNLTDKFAHDIFENGNCQLPNIKDNAILHYEIFKLISNHIKIYLGREYKSCPIT